MKLTVEMHQALASINTALLKGDHSELANAFEGVDFRQLLSQEAIAVPRALVKKPMTLLLRTLAEQNDVQDPRFKHLILSDEMFRLRSQTSNVDKPGVNLYGKRVVIIGGTRDIGKAMADIFLSGGAQVSMYSLESGCDITGEADVQRALQSAADEFGGIDVVVNAAGLLKNCKLHEQTAADAAQQINVNFVGVLNVARLAHFWLEQTQGSLLFFASSSYTRGRAGSAVYSATKAAIENLTQGLSEEWADEGIRVNCIFPRRTDTEMRKTNFKAEAQDIIFNPCRIALSASWVICGVNSGHLERVH